jgi:hypothetical protein
VTLRALPAGDLGTDVYVVSDIGLRWDLASGRKNLGAAIARRLSTPRGMLPWDPNYGFDLRDMLNGSMTATEISKGRGATAAECEKEERVLGAAVNFDFNFATSSLRVDVHLDTADGPFDLILLVTGASIEVLDRNRPAIAIPPGQIGATINIGQVGPPGPPGPAGSGGAGVGGTGTLDLSFPKRMGSSTGSQEIVGQLTVDFNLVAAGTITADLTGYASSAAGTATIRLYVGGTSNAVDGTLVGSTTVATTGDTQIQIGTTFTNPTGVRLVKLSLQSSGAAVDANLLDTEVSFK